MNNKVLLESVMSLYNSALEMHCRISSSFSLLEAGIDRLLFLLLFLLPSKVKQGATSNSLYASVGTYKYSKVPIGGN